MPQLNFNQVIMSTNNSLDPRIQRLDLKKLEEGEVHTNTHSITWEVFHQEKRGKQAVHVGVVHASSPELALLMAKEVFGRRGKTSNLWVVKTTDVYTLRTEDEDIFETVPEKQYREPGAYKVRDRIEKFQKEHKQ
jgi:ring-1,2-phenylacetyl-CoA epoxidase subunit PaaB